MSEETLRARRDRQKVDYARLHDTGHGSSEEISDSNSECSNLFVNKQTRSRPGGKRSDQDGNNKVLVSETPLNTSEFGNNRNSLNSSLNSIHMVPESTASVSKHNSSESHIDLDNIADVGDNANTPSNNLQDEIIEAEMEHRFQAAEEERLELQRRASVLAKQMEVEAKERQVLYMKKQIDKLMEARKVANENDPVFNPMAVGDDETGTQLQKIPEVLQKEEETREKLRKEEEARKIMEEKERKKQDKKRKEEEKQKEKELREKEEKKRRTRSRGALCRAVFLCLCILNV